MDSCVVTIFNTTIRVEISEKKGGFILVKKSMCVYIVIKIIKTDSKKNILSATLYHYLPSTAFKKNSIIFPINSRMRIPIIMIGIHNT